MKKRIFVTATNTNIGKTHTTKLLLRHYASLGFRVGVLKPVETGVVDGFCCDGASLLSVVKELNPLMKDLVISDIVPISYELPAAPFVASGGAKFEMRKVFDAIKKIESLCDLLIIEGAGGLYVPLDENLMIIDMIKETDAVALLVTHCSLGSINDTLLSKKALQERAIAHAVVFNCQENDAHFERVTAPYFLAKDFMILKTSSDIDTLCDLLYNL